LPKRAGFGRPLRVLRRSQACAECVSLTAVPHHNDIMSCRREPCGGRASACVRAADLASPLMVEAANRQDMFMEPRGALEVPDASNFSFHSNSDKVLKARRFALGSISAIISVAARKGPERYCHRGVYHIEDRRVRLCPTVRGISATERRNVDRRRGAPSTKGAARVSSA
jgi:hypothetical protein